MAESQEIKPTIFKTFEDGYIVRRMLPKEASIVQKWFSQIGTVSRYDIDIALSVFPSNSQGFYIGEYEGEVVASAIRIPWGDAWYGSMYFVNDKYRGKGFGTRLRDQVAREYVGKNTCCIDAVLGSVTEKNLSRFGYIIGHKTGYFQTKAQANIVQYSGEIKKATEVPFDDLIAYDNKHFISPNNRERREFLRKWIAIPNGAAFVALDQSGNIVGLGCRRPSIREKANNIGPIYADKPEIANGLLQKLFDGIVGEDVVLTLHHTNPDAIKMVERFNFQNKMNFQRMYLNASMAEPKKTIYAVTSIDVCAF